MAMAWRYVKLAGTDKVGQLVLFWQSALLSNDVETPDLLHGKRKKGGRC